MQLVTGLQDRAPDAQINSLEKHFKCTLRPYFVKRQSKLAF